MEVGMTTARPTVLTLALHAPGADDPLAAGTKAATLASLAAAGFAVPDGVVITTAALASLHETGSDPSGLLPDDVENAMATVLEHFGGAAMAVRSSAVGEDGAVSSYAGQLDTVLNVRGAEALRDAVRTVWASAGSERLAAYRRRDGRVPLAILVQRQVDADVAGVAFTADPVTGARDSVHVSAVPGLGDALVSGASDADEWLVHGGTATPLRVRHQALTEAQARAVAELALRLESVRGYPVDVEWAMAGGRLVVLQARPVTALPSAPAVDLPEGTWLKESERHPEPLTELGASVVSRLVSRGLTTMSRESGGLVDRFEACAVGGEPYLRIVPLGGRGGPPPPWWVLGVLCRVAPPLRRQMRRAKALLRPGVLASRQLAWEQEWRPDVQARIAALQSVDLAALDDAGLAAHLDAALALMDHCLDLHFLLTVAYLVPIHALLVEGDRLGWPELRTMELLAGLSTATSAPSRALAALGASIARHPDAAGALDSPGGDVAARLQALDPALGAAFDDWCTRYGRCCANDDPGSPTLVELPWALAALLRDAVRAAADQSEQRTARARAERAEQARAELAGRPAADRDRFERVLAAAVRAYPLREDSAFWTGSMPGGLLRTAALEIGRRLVARGLLDRPDDAVQLPLDTLRTALSRTGAKDGDLRASVARARAERAWVRANPGPAFHGPEPQPPPDLRGLPAAGRELNEAMLRMQRRRPVAPPDPATGEVLTGVAASPGSYTGPVRVVLGPADFARVRAGDVLVCPTTDPAWSLLFGVAGALITNGGNVLSHAAIVAREHAIPAVVGTGTATRDLHDGQIVTIDGTAGTVTVPSGGKPE
jgi:pyruvate,water dikinase